MATWAQVLGWALMVAVLANGAMTYLKRVGGVERDTYHRYLAAYCSPGGDAASVSACACMVRDPNVLDSAIRFAGELPLEPRLVYSTRPRELWLKAIKDGLFLIAMGVGFLAWRTIQRERRQVRQLLPCAVVLLSVTIGAVIGLANGHPVATLMGLRAFAFLPLSILALPFALHLHRLARPLLALLLVQVLLVAIELRWGFPLRLCPLSFRVAGTLVLPNTLGAAALLLLVFTTSVASAGLGRMGVLLAWGTAIALIACAGSGMGWVGLLAYAAFSLATRLPGRQRVRALLVAVAMGGVLAIVLPQLTNRPDIYDSMFAHGGRVDTFDRQFVAASWPQRLFGQGLGVGSNSAINAADGGDALAVPSEGSTRVFPDSTITALFMQLGLFGVAAFYALLAWGCRRTPEYWAAYSLFAIASLTMNLLELFPANFLLALLLARSLAGDEPSGSAEKGAL